MSLIAKHYLVTGRVQGVSYRASTARRAQQLGLTGWVRNLTDGRVELVASGASEAVAQLELWLWQGPIAAQVTQVQSGNIFEASFSDFTVAPTSHPTTEV
jgi:acylphosphatase